MNFLRKLMEWLSVRPKEVSRKWDPHVNPIDVKKIAAELNLKSEGARLGNAGVPLDDQTELSAPEAQALLAIEQARTDYIEWGRLRLKFLDEQLNRTDISGEVASVTDCADEFDRQAAAVITSNAATIKQLEEEATSLQSQFKQFQEAHGLRSLPNYPKDLYKAFLFVVAIFLIVVEAVANATFFAKGLSGGLIAGFTEAAIAACLNVSISIAFGWLAIRYVHHVKVLPKLVGFMAVATAVAFVFSFSLAVAHYRQALIAGSENAQSMAMQTLLSSPLQLEFSSWILFLVGILFGVVALADGYKMDDSYPGYGPLHRKMLEATSIYTNAIDGLHEHLSGLKQAMLDRVDQAMSQCEASIVSIKNTISDKENCSKELKSMIKDSPFMLGALLMEFRDQNVVSRKAHGHGVPASFSRAPKLQDLDLPDFDTGEDVQKLEQQAQLLLTLRDVAPAIRARIQGAYNANFSSLHTLGRHFDGHGISSKAHNTNDRLVSTEISQLSGKYGV